MIHDQQGYCYHKCMLWLSGYVMLYKSLASFSVIIEQLCTDKMAQVITVNVDGNVRENFLVRVYRNR